MTKIFRAVIVEACLAILRQETLNGTAYSLTVLIKTRNVSRFVLRIEQTSTP